MMAPDLTNLRQSESIPTYLNHEMTGLGDATSSLGALQIQKHFAT